MKHITPETAGEIAQLARLDLSDTELARFSGQLENILSYIDKLNEVDVSGVEPFLNASVGKNIFREDEVKPSLPNDAALANAPSQNDGFFQVPKVTGG